ncbi:MAG: hypothetical protein K2P20_02440 [Oscillospiraceae bacterium]|nr:hypothetical protein [Oscillospiraceae bacterium]
MLWYELHILKQLNKDAVAVNRWNKNTIEKFKRFGYVRSLGVAPKGPAKGRECVLIQENGIAYWDKLKKERADNRRFWIALLMNPISAIIGAVVGYLLSKFFS